MTTAARRNCIIVHGCPSEPEGDGFDRPRSYDRHWIPWVAARLEAAGIPTSVPLMPEPWAPRFADYKTVFETCEVGPQTILIGHSCGCAFLVRWLGETQRTIDTLVLVAPWKVPRAADPVRAAFYDFAIDEGISMRARKILLFTSDTEAVPGKRSLAIYCAALGGDVVDLPGRGHYVSASMGTDEFPELVERLTRAG